LVATVGSLDSFKNTDGSTKEKKGRIKLPLKGGIYFLREIDIIRVAGDEEDGFRFFLFKKD